MRAPGALPGLCCHWPYPPFGPLVSKTEAKTNSPARAAAFLSFEKPKKGGSAACWPERHAPCWTCSSDGATSGREAALVGRPLPPGRGSLRSTSSQPTQWNGGHLRSRLHATTNVVCSSLPRPARHEALHASRLSTAVVHLICNQGVAGSNPAAGTKEIKDLVVPRNRAHQPLREFCVTQAGVRQESWQRIRRCKSSTG